eukprot:m.135453 g.135453  ORF g.135453 m.135453 type:complete len:351 (+) comp29795_c0_seq2:249-1301(+)
MFRGARVLRWRSSLTLRMMATEHGLPILNLDAFVSNTATDREKTTEARKLDLACRDNGFFYLQGHGVSDALCTDMRDAGRAFFRLPDDLKESISVAPGTGRGYQKLAQNVTKGQKDWHEGLDFYRELNDSHPLLQQQSIPSHHRLLLEGKNPWLVHTSTPEFKRLFDEYVASMLATGQAVMRMMAVGMGLPEKHFVENITNESFWGCRLISYPNLQEHEEARISCGEHTDYGCLTFVNQDPIDGSLQVKTATGEWIDANPLEGCFVVNIGDMIERITHGHYQSTPHRVLHTHGGSRISVPFFFEPNFDAVLHPLETPRFHPKAGQPHQTTPVHFGDHLVSKISANFDFDV